MVVPIRKVVNQPFCSSAFNLQPQQMNKIPSNMDIDININIIREKFTSSSKVSLRELSTHLNVSLVLYHKRIEARNNILDEEIQELIDSSYLSYASLNEQREKSVNKAFDNGFQERAQHKCVCNEVLALNSMPEP